jgi:phospho-N-acetylmuramoyl-pentapeptide-transferase
MGFFLGILIISFIINSLLLVPFINFLYKRKIQRKLQKTRDAFNRPTPIFDNLHNLKVGTPLGAGFLLIIVISILFLLSFPVMYFFWIPTSKIYPNMGAEIKILLFSFISFAVIGFYDDLKKIITDSQKKFFGLRLRHKLILEIVLSLLIAFWLFFDLKIQIVHVPFGGVLNLGIFYIPFAAFVIIAFANAYNITDGLDGLAAGLLMIALSAFWVISHTVLDTYISLFIAIWIGGLIAFCYFNVYPARIFLGDVGALAFGATFAVIGLLLGKIFSLLIIGGLFVLEVSSSFLQLLSKKYRRKKLMLVSPLHLLLQTRGWNESTIVFRSWLAGIILAIFGLWLAFMK